MALLLLILALAAWFNVSFANTPGNHTNKQCATSRYDHKHRVFVLSDISNELDDQMSLVRLLTYANEIDIQGFSLVTSTWKNDSLDTSTVIEVIKGYGNVTGNLNANAPPSARYPSAEDLLDEVYEGHPVYGLAALELPPSQAATALIAAANAGSADQPLWVTMWGGGNILAEALQNVRDPE